MDFNVHCAVMRTIHTNKGEPKTALSPSLRSRSFNRPCMAYIHSQRQHNRAEQSKVNHFENGRSSYIFRCRIAFFRLSLYNIKPKVGYFSTYSLRVPDPLPLSFCSSSHLMIYIIFVYCQQSLFILDALWNTFFQKLFYSRVSTMHCVRKCVCVHECGRFSSSCSSLLYLVYYICYNLAKPLRTLYYTTFVVFFRPCVFSSFFHQFQLYYILLTAVVCSYSTRRNSKL